MRLNITDLSNNINSWWNENKDTIFWGITVFLGVVLIIGFMRFSILWQKSSPILFTETESAVSEKDLYEQYMAASNLPGMVIASQNGKRYYYPWCGGLNRIKEKNRIWFKTKEDAERAGYTLAHGCNGL